MPARTPAPRPAAVPRVAHFLSTSLDPAAASTYLDGMEDPSRLTFAAASPDPATGLRAVVALGKLRDQLEAVQVANARAQGWSWQAIAEQLGISKQAVHQKYNRKTR